MVFASKQGLGCVGPLESGLKTVAEFICVDSDLSYSYLDRVVIS